MRSRVVWSSHPWAILNIQDGVQDGCRKRLKSKILHYFNVFRHKSMNYVATNTFWWPNIYIQIISEIFGAPMLWQWSKWLRYGPKRWQKKDEIVISLERLVIALCWVLFYLLGMWYNYNVLINVLYAMYYIKLSFQ